MKTSINIQQSFTLPVVKQVAGNGFMAINEGRDYDPYPWVLN